MSKLPWPRGPDRRSDDVNSDESLQSDVMRFMAILSLCLVAIFALVKSAPLTSVGEPASLVTIPSEPGPPPPGPATRAPVAQLPVNPPRAATEPSVPVDRKGFTLRFASGTALKTLMARGEVDVFARVRRDMWRLRLDNGRLRFESTRAPDRFHEMSLETVPAEIVSALRRDAVPRDLGDVTWGVTLPPRVTAQIRRAIDGRDGGSLVIEGDGRVSLDPGERR